MSKHITPGYMAIVLIALLFIVNIALPIYNETSKKPGFKETIYNPALDVKAAVTSAVEKAGKENKHILLMFGANWCPWCHRLHNLFNSDGPIKKLLESNYIIILVDIGEKPNEPLNRDLEEFYRVKGFGYPCLTVLDVKGKLICTQSSGVLEKDKGHDPQRVLGFLKAQAPQK